jgi:hypothetical protein
MRKKGQMSLEMIIGLLILLVVAVVVIRIFLSSMEGSKDVAKVKDSLKWKEFKSQCESYCNEFKLSGSRAMLSKFCSKKLQGDTDLNRNGMVDEIPADTKVLDICEDAVYCFHVYECKGDSGSIDWDDCRRVVCDSYYDVYENIETTNQKVRELFPSEGGCQLPPSDNWWYGYFGPNPCTNPPTGLGRACIESISDCQINQASMTFQCTAQLSDNPATDCDPNEFVLAAKDSDSDVVVSAPGQGSGYGTVDFSTPGTITGTLIVGQTNDGLNLGPCGSDPSMGVYYRTETPLISFDGSNCQIV